MKNLVKLKVILLVFAIIFASKSIAADKILPLPKPSVDKDTIIKSSKKKEIYPKKKPTKEKIETNVEVVETIETTDKEIFILPVKKPVFVKKEIDKSVVKSKILSKRDFKLAKSAFKYIDKKKWKSALKISTKAKDETLYNLINYLYLKKTSNSASFYDYFIFINSNKEFPRINRLKYLAEHKINLKNNSPQSIIKWFDGKKPLSDFGKIKLGEAHITQGNIEKGSKLIKEGWVKAKLAKSDLRYLR